MSGRSKQPEHSDGRVSHEVERYLDVARGRTRAKRYVPGRTHARKQRLPAKDSHIARIASVDRNAVVAEVESRRDGAGLTMFDWDAIDTYYWATCGILKGYQHLEHSGWLDEEQHAFHPLIETLGRLKRQRSDSLRLLGLDKRPERDLGFLDMPHTAHEDAAQRAETITVDTADADPEADARGDVGNQSEGG